MNESMPPPEIANDATPPRFIGFNVPSVSAVPMRENAVMGRCSSAGCSICNDPRCADPNGKH